MSSSLPVARVLVVCGAVFLSLSACGRRGALEPPPDPTVSAEQRQKQVQAIEDEDTEPAVPSPVGTSRPRNTKRGFVIPKEPFVLDPLL